MKKLLFNPGPTNVSENVRSALKTNDICHRESEFFNVLANVRKNLLKVVNGEGTHTVVAFVSSGTGCNEAVISSIHGKLLLINNGKTFFGLSPSPKTALHILYIVDFKFALVPTTSTSNSLVNLLTP